MYSLVVLHCTLHCVEPYFCLCFHLAPDLFLFECYVLTNQLMSSAYGDFNVILQSTPFYFPRQNSMFIYFPHPSNDQVVPLLLGLYILNVMQPLQIENLWSLNLRNNQTACWFGVHIILAVEAFAGMRRLRCRVKSKAVKNSLTLSVRGREIRFSPAKYLHDNCISFGVVRSPPPPGGVMYFFNRLRWRWRMM
jgi:hypothetical protein